MVTSDNVADSARAGGDERVVEEGLVIRRLILVPHRHTQSLFSAPSHFRHRPLHSASATPLRIPQPAVGGHPTQIFQDDQLEAAQRWPLQHRVRVLQQHRVQVKQEQVRPRRQKRTGDVVPDRLRKSTAVNLGMVGGRTPTRPLAQRTHSCSIAQARRGWLALAHPGPEPHIFQPGSCDHDVKKQGIRGVVCGAAWRSASHVASPSVKGKKCSNPAWRNRRIRLRASEMAQKSKASKISSPWKARASSAR